MYPSSKKKLKINDSSLSQYWCYLSTFYSFINKYISQLKYAWYRLIRLLNSLITVQGDHIRDPILSHYIPLVKPVKNKLLFDNCLKLEKVSYRTVGKICFIFITKTSQEKLTDKSIFS